MRKGEEGSTSAATAASSPTGARRSDEIPSGTGSDANPSSRAATNSTFSKYLVDCQHPSPNVAAHSDPKKATPAGDSPPSDGGDGGGEGDGSEDARAPTDDFDPAFAALMTGCALVAWSGEGRAEDAKALLDKITILRTDISTPAVLGSS
eukprot:CAMPEP_0183293318 /NCGR_PEP_ID=MMETSP0160_2-20130417/2044_1 /TAXON_ID=2839 ORGANISM="Odontella Sinensis, Strain Grunow 1884" /NCGR_SAMPLE_ID=MMETSP0160_2 /ASSEMBLY_ACC=CAM_ASM_000250 /LENGTH=149 /DNA_ID=CAMNT_0025454413 /DNA_START=693 /DNA_END=1139 /DNA_ORIENTATION=+